MLKAKLAHTNQPVQIILRRFLNYGDRPWRGLIALMGILVIILVLLIGWFLWNSSGMARTALGWGFLAPAAEGSWDPGAGAFLAWPFLYGTLITSLVAIVIAVPTGLGIAIFLSDLCPDWLKMPLGMMVELLAAIPSVVYGLWGIFIFLPAVVEPVGTFLDAALSQIPIIGAFFVGPIPASGASRLAAGLILTIMIIPTIAAVSRDVFNAIPPSQREASLALGATKWETIYRVMIPYGMSGILGATILGLGRAIGETMAVTMVIGQNPLTGSVSLLQSGYSLSSIIANEFGDTVNKLHTEVLIEIGFILFILTLLLNFIARLLVWRVARKTPQEAR